MSNIIPSYEELYNLAYIPGAWICSKCGFTLNKNTICISQGAIGTTEKDRQSEACPNDGEWMEPATYKEAAKSNQAYVSDLFDFIESEGLLEKFHQRKPKEVVDAE